jgi:hypothetical protein
MQYRISDMPYTFEVLTFSVKPYNCRILKRSVENVS